MKWKNDIKALKYGKLTIERHFFIEWKELTKLNNKYFRRLSQQLNKSFSHVKINLLETWTICRYTHIQSTLKKYILFQNEYIEE